MLGTLWRSLLRLWIVLGKESLGSLTLRYDDSVALLDVRLACSQLKGRRHIRDERCIEIRLESQELKSLEPNLN